MKYAYLFETRGIQRFLFASGKLRDMLGGSELLDYLSAEGGLLDQTLEALDLAPSAPRRAGGAFYLIFNKHEDAIRLRDTWRLASSRWLPGVEKVDALAQGETAHAAISAGFEQLRQARNHLSTDLPRPGPLTERSPRTALAAVAQRRDESLDAVSLRQRSFSRPADGQNLAQRFLDEPGYVWPLEFEENSPADKRFPLGERRLVGLIHADGNGLGELLRILNSACAGTDDKTYVKLYRSFSEGLASATQAAANQASREVLLEKAQQYVLPARPLVLGGDDLTIIVRADLALPFARAFLTAFEQHSRQSMRELQQAFEQSGLNAQAAQLPDYLSACAGLCFMKCSQPFQAGHDLAESLCKRAKVAARKARQGNEPMPATLAMHKVQDSLLEDADTQFVQNHCFSHEGRTWQLALPAYALAPGHELPALDDLEAMLQTFNRRSPNSLNDRPLRELATLWHDNPSLARQAYVRWRELAGRNNATTLDEFDRHLRALLGQVQSDLPCSLHETPQSPLADLLALLSLQIPSNPASEGQQ